MRRIIITSLCLVLLALGWQQARGFALLGPLENYPGLPADNGDTWQTPTIGYALPEDVGLPKNVGQGYRRNIPYMYYSDNASFYDYFGLQGEEAVDSAFAILNNSFTNNAVGSLDGYSSNLVEFPFNSQGYNYTAESLGLTDLKSEVLTLMMEQLGLAEPERYTWTLHDRFLPSGGTCPVDELYLVVQRNYYYTPSPLYENLYSPYVNDTLYTYEIEELCNPPVPPDAVTVPLASDPYAQMYTAVAGLGAGLGITADTVTNGFGEPIWESIETGGYYNGLTRDDIGGLRYLMTSNNIVFEDPGLGSLLESTNFGQIQNLTTFPLFPLLSFAQTNPPAAVLAFAAAQGYPNLAIDTVSNYFTLVTNWITTSSIEPVIPSSYAGQVQLVITTNGFTVSWQTNYVYTFGNMVTFDYHTNTFAYLQTVSLKEVIPSSYAGQVYTNISNSPILLNIPSGQFYLLPTNSCGFDFVYTNFLNAFAGYYTNSVIAEATNTLVGIGPPGFVGSESVVVPLTNSFLEYYGCTLIASNGPNYYQGIGRIHFIRVPDNNLDSLSGFFRQPITNSYTMVWYNPTNYQLGGTQTFQRIVTQPDIMFDGADLASPNAPEIGVQMGARTTPNFDVANVIPNDAGPGTINPTTVITFNTVGDVFGNGSVAEEFSSTNGLLNQTTQGGLLAYASFDGTTNQPVVYPNGTSIQDLENELIITVTPSTLPNGTNNVPYPMTTFNVSSGQPPYTWSLDGTQLPTGLNFYNGVLSGEPVGNTNGTYDFIIQMTDSANRTVNLNYSINIQ